MRAYANFSALGHNDATFVCYTKLPPCCLRILYRHYARFTCDQPRIEFLPIVVYVYFRQQVQKV